MGATLTKRAYSAPYKGNPRNAASSFPPLSVSLFSLCCVLCVRGRGGEERRVATLPRLGDPPLARKMRMSAEKVGTGIARLLPASEMGAHARRSRVLPSHLRAVVRETDATAPRAASSSDALRGPVPYIAQELGAKHYNFLTPSLLLRCFR